MKIKDLTVEEKIGQMLMIGLDSQEALKKLEPLIKKYKIGGVLLYKKNYKNYEELVNLINKIKEFNKDNKIPMFIAIDQEGGRVNRMPKDFINLPSAYKLAQYSENNEEDLVKMSGEITGELLNKTGVNMNLAPVLDIKRFEDKQAIGDRAYGDNIDIISKYGTSYINELKSKNIISVIKHFPGHGLTNKDTHFILPMVKKDMEEIEKEDMIPFEKAINQGVDSILVGHLRFKNVTRQFTSINVKKIYI